MSAELAARALRELQEDDFRVLRAIEQGLSRFEYVPVDQIARISGFTPGEADFRLKRLHKLGILKRWAGPYVGYTLKYAGFDCLALNALVKQGALEKLGIPLGIGKEADVHDGFTSEGERVAVKFHRLGRASFRQTRRLRGYAADRRWALWYTQSKLAAEREYRALELAHPAGVAVPKPVAWNRHVVVMGVIMGAPLAGYADIPSPRAVLREILENVRKAYLDAGIVHADLSEYNVLIKPDAHILIIDWPQFVTKDHPNAFDLLRRDVKNLLRFFKRKFRIEMDLENALSFVTSL